MTRQEYEAKVATFDQDRIQSMIDRIPWNINRAGKHYQKLLKEIELCTQKKERS
jgi:hypothetical protein